MTQEYKIGDTLKCYDFPGNKTCYMIGEVTEVSEDHYVCKSISCTFNGEDKIKFNPTFTPLKQGESMFDIPSDPRIIKIE